MTNFSTSLRDTSYKKSMLGYPGGQVRLMVNATDGGRMGWTRTPGFLSVLPGSWPQGSPVPVDQEPGAPAGASRLSVFSRVSEACSQELEPGHHHGDAAG